MSDAELSIAALLDDVRPLVVAARAGGGDPKFLLLPPRSFDAVARVREADRKRGLPITVLGMEAVRADDPAARPKVF